MDNTADLSSDVEALIAALRAKATEHADDPAFGKHCREAILKICKDRALAAFIDGAAFGEVSPVESFRRLALLRKLTPGTFCSDRAWGFGIVRNADEFYKRLVIDFDQKRGHRMTYAYAAETLAIVDDNHLLARRHKDPAGLEALVREQPGEIVRMALRTFGPMPVAKLEKTLTDARIVAPSRWKTFWDGARKELKKDPLVDLPAKRTEPITILSREQDYGESWLAAFRQERDIGRILGLIGDLETQAPDKIPQAAEGLSDRLAFALKGAYNSDPANFARLAMAVQRLGLAEPGAAPLKDHLWEENRFIAASEALSVRESAELAGYLLKDDPEAQCRIVGHIPLLPYSIAGEVLQILHGGPADAAARDLCRSVLQAVDPHPVLLAWAIRNRDAFADWNLPSPYDLLMKGVSLLDEKRSGEALRMQHSIRLVFDNAKGFETLFSAMDSLQRQALFERIQASGSWDPASRRRLLNHMIRIEPKLAAHRKAAASAPAGQAERRTSWRSLAERRAAHRHLVEVEIPQNSREIAEARSYGDLSENFEYQAARHQQGLLLQRQAEMDADLRQVKGTDFANAPTDRAGAGTAVTLRLPDDSRVTYHILGEWDRDEALNIISCKSKLALCIEGKGVGDRVLVPGAAGETMATVDAVGPLPESVRAWIAEPPPAQTPRKD